MKKITLLLVLSVWCVQAQTSKCPPEASSGKSIQTIASAVVTQPQNRLGGGELCSASVVPPAVVNGVNVTDQYSGDVTFYPSAYSSCTPPIFTPENSRHLGSNGEFVYTMNFSQPINNLVIVINAAGYEFNEVFTFTTNGGLPVITATASCFTTIIGNTIYSGEGTTPQNSHNGGGGIFTITAPSNFTSVTISGPGGVAGSLLSICENSITPANCLVDAAPILSTTSIDNICPANTVDLTSITATNWPIFTGVVLTWHTSLPVSNANKLTMAQAGQVPAGPTYYAAFYDPVNDCYGEATPVTTILNPLIVPTFTQIGPYCLGEIIPLLPNVSNNSIGGVWSPAINPNATTTYTFTPTGTLCAATVTMSIVVNQPATPLFDPVSPICQGDAVVELPTVSNNNISGSWFPPINNMETTNYTFTPGPAQCAVPTNLMIAVLPIPDIEVSSRCAGTDYVLTASSQTPEVTYEWFNASGNSLGTNPSVIIATAGEYTVILSSEDCETTQTVNISSIYCDIPKGISPDGDGKNDFFDLSNYEVDHLKIFNRYGMVVYEMDHYQKEWGGYSDSGKELPDATYYYYIRFQNGESKTGWVYLNRKH